MDNLLCLGCDVKGKYHYITVPTLLESYKFDIQSGIRVGLRRFSLEDKSYSLLIDNMKSRDMLHKFLKKHMLSLFNSIGYDEDILDSKLKEECKVLFDVAIWDSSMDKLYKNYKKGTSIESMVSKHISSKLKDYKERLDEVEY